MNNSSKGQSSNNKQSNYQRAIQEVEFVLGSADKIDNPLAKIRIKANAATLLWAQSPEQARRVFLNLWNFIDGQTDTTFSKEEARTVLLRYIFSKDRTLANQLLQKTASQNKDKEVSAFDKINGNDPETRQLAFLSYNLVGSDLILAAQLFEQSLAQRVSPMTPPILLKIREKNPQLANYLASRAIESINRQPRTIAVFGLTTLAGYLFPLMPQPVMFPEAAESDDNLHFQFMSVGYWVLKESLAETDEFLIREQQMSKESLRFRATSQALLAAILSALSSNYFSQYLVELNEITTRLSINLPKQVVSLIQMQIAAVKSKIGINSSTEGAEVSEAEITQALTKEDFKTAQNLIDKLKDESKKKIWTQLLLKAQSKIFLANGELLMALNTVRKIENIGQRMLSLIEIAKAAQIKRDQALSMEIFYEARKTSADSLPKTTHAITLFAIASDTAYLSVPEAKLMLQDAITVVNSMAFSDEKETNLDLNKLVGATEMIRAFAILGELDMDDTLHLAGKLENKAIQSMARLATVEKIIKKGPQKIKPEVRQITPSKTKQ